MNKNKSHCRHCNRPIFWDSYYDYWYHIDFRGTHIRSCYEAEPLPCNDEGKDCGKCLDCLRLEKENAR